VGVRLSGGLGPLRVSVPLTPRRRRRGGGGGASALAGLFKGTGLLMWWMLVYCCYWPMRLVYWELPRWIWREVQRRRAAQPAPSGPGSQAGL
jgi:hypothetical protein